MSCGATILVISPRQNLYTLTDSHEEDFVTRSAVGQKENYVKNQMRQHRGSIALTTLALLLIITVRVIFIINYMRRRSSAFGRLQENQLNITSMKLSLLKRYLNRPP